jgi:hypothetical protein
MPAAQKLPKLVCTERKVGLSVCCTSLRVQLCAQDISQMLLGDFKTSVMFIMWISSFFTHIILALLTKGDAFIKHTKLSIRLSLLFYKFQIISNNTSPKKVDMTYTCIKGSMYFLWV